MRNTLIGLLVAGIGAALLLAAMRLRSGFEVNIGNQSARLGCASSGTSSKFYFERDGPGIIHRSLASLVWDDSINDVARDGLLGFGYGTETWSDNGGGYIRMVKTPAWFPASGMGAALLWACGLARRSRRALQAGRCARCGYDLRASPERCPECGLIPAIAVPREKSAVRSGRD